MENKKSGNFPEWYVEALTGARLFDYAPVHGCIIFRERGYAIWEFIQREMDGRIKGMGVKNCYFPMFIPESLLNKEAEHFKGFVPEVAWVERKDEKEERVALRPTSETIIYDAFSRWIRSHRDLPLKINQWCNIVRWEIKQTKPFIRTREFLWQEGHTAHATQEQAEKMVEQALKSYMDLAENILAVPVMAGRKTKLETFAGAVYTTTIEGLMPDGKALQMGTSHYLGTHFPQMYGVKYMDESEKEQFAHTTSWGVSTRLIGALAMAHGDDRGLILPPKVAPEQVVIIPIIKEESKARVLEKAKELEKKLNGAGIRAIADLDELHTPGWKFAEYELWGVPVRLEIGPKDLEKGQVTLVRRDNGEKKAWPEAEVTMHVEQLLVSIQSDLLVKARKTLEANTVVAKERKQLLDAVANRKLVKMMHCGRDECEEQTKTDTEGGGIRVIPFEQEKLSETCAACGQPAKHMVYLAKSY